MSQGITAEIPFDASDIEKAEREEKHCIAVVIFDPRARQYQYWTGRASPKDAALLASRATAGTINFQ